MNIHIIKNPAGTYSFVGCLPSVLGDEVDATKADVLGCRAYLNEAGELKVIKFPSFPTYDEAAAHAQVRVGVRL